MRSARLVLFVLGAAGAALAAGAWRTSAQSRQPSDGSPVQVVTGNRVAMPVDPDDRGATFYWLESHIVRKTTRFGDAVATAERTAEGDLRTRLTDRAGNPLATFTVDRVGAASEVLDYQGQEGPRIGAVAKANLRPTLAWANHQAYRLWKDVRGPDAPPLEWRGRLMRPRGARAHDPDADVAEVRAEWASGLVTTARSTDHAVRRHAVTGRPFRGRIVTSRLVGDGVELGYSQWYAAEKVYAWSFPGLTEGYLDEKRLADVGGWTFTPDLEWVAVQSYAFHYFHSRMATQSPPGAPASASGASLPTQPWGTQGSASRPPARWLDRTVRFFLPTLSANEPGCDGLHWLDGSAFRPCCDGHDRCYEKYACSYKSWWMWWSSWRCDMCNLWVVTCFVSGGKVPYQQTPY